MKKLLFVMLVLLGLEPAFASSFRILTIRNDQSTFSKQFFAGFSSSTPEKIIAFDFVGENGKLLSKKIKEISPDLVMTIGQLPIHTAITDLPSTPFLVSNLQSTSLENRNNVIMIHHDISMAQKLSMLKFLFPKIKTIGTMYDPVFSAKEYESFALAATRLGLTALSIKVSSEKEVASYMQGLKDKIDSFYYISDQTTSGDQASTPLYEFLNQNQIPSLSSNFEHCGKGAVLTISPDPIRLGEKTWEAAHEILQAGKVQNKNVHLSEEEYILSASLQSLEKFKVEQKLIMEFTKQAVNRGWKVFWQM